MTGDCFACNICSFLRPAAKRNLFQDSTAASVASGASRTTQSNNTRSLPGGSDGPIMVDFTKADYRAFIFVLHPDHGYMMLHCTRKKKKPNHFQLPGGHVDDFEFEEAKKLYPKEPLQQLLHAGRMGGARELYEETGIDIRKSLNRLAPAKLYKEPPEGKLGNEYKTRLFFTLHAEDDDFLKEDDLPVSEAAFLKPPMGTNPPKLKLKLSHEHQGFAFEKYSDVAITLLQHHSGGKCSEALRMGTKISEQEGAMASMELPSPP